MKVLEHAPHDFRHTITLQNETTSENAEGLQSKSWANVAGLENLPAKIKFLTGRELAVAGMMPEVYQAEVTIYKPDVSVDTSMRLVFDGINYDVKSVIPDYTNQLYLTMTVNKESV